MNRNTVATHMIEHIQSVKMPLEGNVIIGNLKVRRVFVKVLYWMFTDLRKDEGIVKFEKIEKDLAHLLDQGKMFYSMDKIMKIADFKKNEFLLEYMFPIGSTPNARILANYIKNNKRNKRMELKYD